MTEAELNRLQLRLAEALSAIDFVNRALHSVRSTLEPDDNDFFRQSRRKASRVVREIDELSNILDSDRANEQHVEQLRKP